MYKVDKKRDIVGQIPDWQKIFLSPEPNYRLDFREQYIHRVLSSRQTQSEMQGLTSLRGTPLDALSNLSPEMYSTSAKIFSFLHLNVAPLLIH